MTTFIFLFFRSDRVRTNDGRREIRPKKTVNSFAYSSIDRGKKKIIFSTRLHGLIGNIQMQVTNRKSSIQVKWIKFIGDSTHLHTTIPSRCNSSSNWGNDQTQIHHILFRARKWHRLICITAVPQNQKLIGKMKPTFSLTRPWQWRTESRAKC